MRSSTRLRAAPAPRSARHPVRLSALTGGSRRRSAPSGAAVLDRGGAGARQTEACRTGPWLTSSRGPFNGIEVVQHTVRVPRRSGPLALSRLFAFRPLYIAEHAQRRASVCHGYSRFATPRLSSRSDAHGS